MDIVRQKQQKNPYLQTNRQLVLELHYIIWKLCVKLYFYCKGLNTCEENSNFHTLLNHQAHCIYFAFGAEIMTGEDGIEWDSAESEQLSS